VVKQLLLGLRKTRTTFTTPAVVEAEKNKTVQTFYNVAIPVEVKKKKKKKQQSKQRVVTKTETMLESADS